MPALTMSLVLVGDTSTKDELPEITILQVTANDAVWLVSHSSHVFGLVCLNLFCLSCL